MSIRERIWPINDSDSGISINMDINKQYLTQDLIPVEYRLFQCSRIVAQIVTCTV